MPGMVPSDVYALTGAGDPRISPDGRTVAFSVTAIDKDANEYTSDIYLAPADSSSSAERLTATGKRNAAPRWSPDGKLLAFVSNRATKTMQLFVLPIGGGDARQLTDLDEDVTDVAWAPDSTVIAFTSRVRDEAYEEEDERKRAPRRIKRLQFKLDNVGWTCDRRSHVFTVPIDGSQDATQITKGDFDHSSPRFSPDGSRIAFSAARHDDWDIRPADDIYVVGASGGEPQKLTATDGSVSTPVWSADGSQIAYHYTPGLFDDPRHGQVAVIDAGGGETRVLTSDLDRQCAPYPLIREPAWIGKDIYFCLEDLGDTHVYKVTADGSSAAELVVGGTLVVTGFDVHDDKVLYTASTPTELAELFDGSGKKLTEVGAAFSAGRTIVAPERFVAISKDGTEVQAWVVRPAGFEEGKSYPALINIHGGPFTQYGNKLFDEFQVYAGAGYAVIYTDPRGSSGHSQEWARAIRAVDGGSGWGSVDFEDIMAVTEEACRRFDFIDDDRLGVLGGSYGGFMTSWIVSHSDRFKAACSERAVNSWYSMHGSSDFGWVFKGYMGGFLHEDPETWLRSSPLTYAKDITTPLLILHSEDDLRCNIEQGEQLFTVLRLLEREVEFVRFPAEGHELTRGGNPVHRVQRFEILIEFFDRHLKTGDA